MRTRTQLEQRNAMVPPLDILTVGRESNAAISITNLQHMRKAVATGKAHEQGADMHQGEMNRYMNDFNYQLQSMGDFSEKNSTGAFT